MVAARRVEVREARVHEQVCHLLDKLDVDDLLAVHLNGGQAHESEPQLRQLTICARHR